MQAPVARGLRLFDVVRLADDVVRFRPGQQAAQIVDIVQIVADDADSGHILNVRVDIVDGQLIAAALELFLDTVERLDSVFDVVDGGVVVERAEFLIQNFHLGHGHLQRTAVQMVHPHHSLSQLKLLLRNPGRRADVLETDIAGGFDHHGVPSL